jgi:hypothetical protein
MLAGPKGEFDPETTSFAAPVFGKGRVLGAWPLTLLDDATLEEASMFLVGRCGCRIKNDNPGWDLLLNVDWEIALQAAGQARAGSKESNKSDVFAPQAPEVVAIIPEATGQDPGEGGGSLWAALSAVILAMIVLWGMKSRRV